jgi:hypothetical protein
MRLFLNNTEFYVFKGTFFKRPIWYYNNSNTTLADKFFAPDSYLVSKDVMNFIDIFISSDKAPELVSKSKEVSASIEEQITDLKTFLKYHFDIEVDEKERFYTYINIHKKTKHGFVSKKKKMFFSFEEAIQIYSMPHHHFSICFKEDDKNLNMKKQKYVEKKLKTLNNSFEMKKKYVYITVKRTSKKYGTYILDNPTVVTIPQ